MENVWERFWILSDICLYILGICLDKQIQEEIKHFVDIVITGQKDTLFVKQKSSNIVEHKSWQNYIISIISIKKVWSFQRKRGIWIILITCKIDRISK